MDKISKFIKPKTTFGDILRFTPYAWAKLLWMRDYGDTEVAGYATTGTSDPLLVTDFRLIKQNCTEASFDLDADGLMEDVENTLDAGLAPWQTHNILCHSHPGHSPSPSLTDEKNFEKAFAHPHWAIMFIIAEGGNSYCRMKINIGPGVVKDIKVAIDWKQPFEGTNSKTWEKEYQKNVTELKLYIKGKEKIIHNVDENLLDEYFGYPIWHINKEDRYMELEKIHDESEEFDEIECFWDVYGCVSYWNEKEEEWFLYDPIKELWYIDNIDNEVIPPNENWVVQIVSWAHQYLEDRSAALEETI